MSDILLEVKNLKKYFDVGNGKVLKAVDNVSFAVRKGETLGLVGESGCGKSTTGKTIMKFLRPTGGNIIFDGKDISNISKKEYFDFTQRAQMIFQDPYASLDSRMTAGNIIAEGMETHHLYSAKERRERVYELLNTVGLSKEHANRFAHEFSGGQRQRIGIARALSINPKFIVCDEPVSALDVSVQAQVINLLLELQRNMGLTYLFIAHDLSVVKHISDNVAVMYLGTIVELASSHELYDKPQHPYTQALLSAIPVPSLHNRKKRIIMKGEITSPINPPKACRFAQRCPYATERCTCEEPELRDYGNGHSVACFLCEK